MQKKKKIASKTCSILLAGTMLMGTMPYAALAADISGHWAEKQLQQFIDEGYLKGDGTGNYLPNQTISRAEFAAMVNRYFGYTTQSSDISKYTDVASGAWYQADLAKALAAGYMSGTTASTMAPTTPVTREQAFTMLARALKLADGDASTLSAFADGAQTASYAKGPAAALVTKKIISGNEANQLMPTKIMTRAEAVTMLSRITKDNGNNNSNNNNNNNNNNSGNNSGGSSSGGGGHHSGGSSSSQYTYVLMNIPYDTFYKTEVKNNTADVDVVSSATKSKPANSNLAAGSYHKEDNSEITGVTFPIRINKNTDLTKLTTLTKADSEDALFAGASYSYYAMSGTPSCYKDLTVADDGTFTLSEVKGTSSAVADVNASISDSSNYGDYQISLSSDNLTADTLGTVYGVVLNTKEGSSYALRHLENIWLRTSLAFSTGFTTTSHGSPLAADHYKAIMGQTINSITYYTSNGIKTISVDLYVPTKFEHTLSVANAVDTNTAAVTKSGFPEAYQAKYEVLYGGKTVEGATCDGTTVTLPTDAKVGVYTLKVTDEKGKYASYSTTFEKQTATNPVTYSNDNLSLTAANGKTDADVESYVSGITEVTVGDKTYAASGRGATKIINENGGLDLTAAPFADLVAGKEYTITVKATGYSTPLTFTVTVPDTIYAYASVPYDEYWKNEGVYMTGTDWKASSDESDYDYDYKPITLKEHDKGAYDAVSRATARHGIHRGSYQQVLTFHTQEGKDLEVAYWINGSSLVLKDGSTATFTSTTPATNSDPVATITVGRNTYHMTGSTLNGIKYVPVSVSANDFAAFSQKYEVTMNGDLLTGGYTERMLLGYNDLVAAVDANTDGLKAVTKDSDGNFSFGKRQEKNGSGIKGTSLKIVDPSTVVITPQKFSGGTYGAMFRIHITNANTKAAADSDENVYGQLGSRMQSVTWEYYGTNEGQTTPLATYGTKFAADIWMHGNQGIQLGLTDSLRAKLPEGTNGTGKWVGTIHALGYEDFTFTVNLAEENIRNTGSDPMTDKQKTKLTALVNEAAELLTNYDSTTASDAEKLLKQHYDEASALLANAEATSDAATELLGELPGMIATVKAEHAQQATKTVTGSAPVTGYGYDALVSVTYNPSTGKITKVEDNDTSATGPNAGYWTSAKALFDKLIGKTKDEVANVDAVTRATYSSNAIKTAVQNALNSQD